MYKPILHIVCAFFIALTMSGCIGYIQGYPAECEINAPTTTVHDLKAGQNPEIPVVATKADFLKSWGKPDVVNVTSENIETWTYKRHEWCGSMPALLFLVPLVLPVCAVYERIEFEGDSSKLIHIRYIKDWGYVLIYGAKGSVPPKDTGCKLPRPVYKAVDSDKTKLNANAPH